VNGGLVLAIQQHSSTGFEANNVIARLNRFAPQQQLDLLNFLRWF
jgi:hypothetical protein